MRLSWRWGVTAVALAGALTACAGPATAPALPPYTANCPQSLATDADANAPLLSPDEAIGRGVLVYRTCTVCGTRLLTESGRTYTLPPITLPAPTVMPSAAGSPSALATLDAGGQSVTLDPMYEVRLSPDGRWLARPGPGGTILRDLTGTRVVELDGIPSGFSWSDNGRWLVSGRRAPALLLDLDGDTATEVRLDEAHATWSVVAVFGQHELLLQESYDYEYRDRDRRHETLVTVDPTAGTVVHMYQVDFGPDGAATVDGRRVVMVTNSTESNPGEVVIADIEAGSVVARHPLPVETPAGFGFWHAGRVRDGVVLIRDHNFVGTSPQPVQLFSLDPASGDRRLTCTLPPMTQVVLPH